MTLSSINADKLAILRHLAASGDILAQAAVTAIANETALASIGAGLVSGGTPAAKSATSVHASVFGDAVGPVVLTTGLANPATPRNLRAVFGAAWDGGDVTVVGTNQFGAAVSEVILASAGSTVVGVKVFATITSVAYPGNGVGTHGTNTLTVGTGDKIGLVIIPHTGSPVLLAVDGIGEAVTFDATYNAFTPTTVPNGSHVYVLTFNL